MEYQGYGREVEVPQPRAYQDVAQSQSLLPPQKGAYKFVLGHNWKSWRFVDSEDPEVAPEFLPVLWEGNVKAGCNGVPGLAPGQVHQWSHLAKMRTHAEAKGVDVYAWGDRRLDGFKRHHPAFTGYMIPYATSDGKHAFKHFFMRAVRFPSGDVSWRKDEALERKFLRFIRDEVAQPMVLEVFNRMLKVAQRELQRHLAGEGPNAAAKAKAQSDKIRRMRATYEAMGQRGEAIEIPQPAAEIETDVPQPEPTVTRGGRR